MNQMPTKSQTSSSSRSAQSAGYLNEGLSSKKTAFIIVTVVGCIAILWPKVIHPMMFGGASSPKPNYKESQPSPTGGCCEVVLNKDEFYNVSAKGVSPPTPSSVEIVYGPHLYRKSLNVYTGEISIRQERPTHMHPDAVYQAMRERGRAIPPSQTIPIVERKTSPSNPPPRIIDGKPGPVPGMRPPMGAGALHQPQPKGSSMGIIMPLYTIGIVVFFGYTIMKIVVKKPIPNPPYGPAPLDPNFRKDVFGHENGKQLDDSKLGNKLSSQRESSHCNGNDLYNVSMAATNVATNLSASLKQQKQQSTKSNLLAGSTMLIEENEQLMEIEKLRKKLEDTEKAMAKLIAEMNSDQYEAKRTNEKMIITNREDISNGHAHTVSNDHLVVDNIKADVATNKKGNIHDNTERTVAILGMEITASCEGGQKWSGRPPPSILLSHHEHSKLFEDELPEPKSIYLEGTLAHDSQILVADSEIKQETVYDTELNGSIEEPAIVLSSKMTLSLINLDNILDKSHATEIDSPLADDIEIISHDDN